MSFAFIVYRAATRLAAPVLPLLLRRRARRGKEVADRLGERWGAEPTPRPAGPLLWLHAASVGETLSVLSVLPHLPAEWQVLFTTGTVTSATLLEARLREEGLSGRMRHRFAPLDVPAWVARFLDHWRPDAAAFVESELWPNVLAACRMRAIPTALINGRMSRRSYGGWRRAPGLVRTMLGGFALLHPRSEADAARLRALGGTALLPAGDLKFAASPPACDEAELARLRNVIGDRPCWLAASTHEGDEEIVLAIHHRLAPLFPGLLTIVAPRHPARGAGLSRTHGWPRRGAGQPPPEGGVWLADTLGEMGLWYRLCPAVLMGKSLLPPGGGHNPIEPARLGCAVAMGPHAGNFEEAVETLERLDALSRVGEEAAAAAWLAATLSRPGRRRIDLAFEKLPRELAGRLAALPALGARL